MAFIHISSDPTKKIGFVIFSDDGGYSPIHSMPCYEIIDMAEYKSLDCLSWYLYQMYKGFSLKIDYFL